jgi:MerR family transcriptional regulator, light-induced transcriptional regulator
MSNVCPLYVYTDAMSAVDPPAHHLRIGQLASRVGVSATLLRAWERRYGLLQPVRTEGGYRLYSAEDEARVHSMLALITDGVAPQQAARRVMSDTAPAVVARADDASPARDLVLLAAALERFDDVAANAIFDELLARYTVRTALSAVVVPYLAGLGDRWARGEATIAQEHFASNVLRGRLLGLARGWDAGVGPRALLACPSGERHDLGLLVFGIALRGHGWRITYLGADTPQTTLIETAAQLAPAIMVLAATRSSHLRPLAHEARSNAVPIAIAGRGATRKVADELGAALLDVDPVSAAARVAAEAQ